MQTFLPYSDFEKSAEALDLRRLNKQITEAGQIVDAIENHLNGFKSAWIAHPASLMWYECIDGLLAYAYTCRQEFKKRGGNYIRVPRFKPSDSRPYWWQDKRIFESHKKALEQKWQNKTDYEYHWPWLYWSTRTVVNMKVLDMPQNQVMLFPPGKDGSPPLDSLRYPRFGSIKYDGTYCLVYAGELYTRTLKPMPNQFLRKRLESLLRYSLDYRMVFMGELHDTSRSFHAGQSVVRSYAGELYDTSLYVFDCLRKSDYDSKTGGNPYHVRYSNYTSILRGLSCEYVRPVEQCKLSSVFAATEFYKAAIANGHEGIVTRGINSYYKHGRCSPKDEDLARHREIARCDAVVVDINQGKKLKEGIERNRLLSGLLDRPHKQEEYEPDEIAGSITVKTEDGIVCNAGFGENWTLNDRRVLWKEKDYYIGKTVEIQYNPLDNLNKLRQPKILFFRHDK